MSRPSVTTTITYRNPDTVPPVFVAGSFSEPKWTPLEMEYACDADGVYIFTRQVCLVPGREYEFKFRLGNSDQWVVNRDYPTTYDEIGNQNNMLETKSEGNLPIPENMPGKALNDQGIINVEDSSETKPADESASKAESVEDKVLNDADLDRPSHDGDDGERLPQDCAPVISPLFAHESFGACEFANDGSDQEESVSMIPRLSKMASKDFLSEEVDPNDPMIERFPSERGSVMDALRKIQSSSSDDHLHAIKASMSPFTGPRRESVDSATDDILSTGSLSPTNNSAPERRDILPSHSGLFRTRSAVSLDSIAEEEPKDPKSDLPSMRNGGKDANTPRKSVFEGLESGPSDEDEGIMFENAKASRVDKADNQPQKWFGITG